MNKSINKLELLLHILVWGVIILSPLMVINSHDKLNMNMILVGMINPIFLCILFYLNYFWLAPKYLLTHKSLKFLAINVVAVVLFGVTMHLSMEMCHDLLPPMEERVKDKRMRFGRKDGPPHRSFFLMRNIITLALASTTACAIVLTGKWKNSEKEKEEAESARIEAELKNLRSQVNPHFLLNTLNNIYALTTFDATKAQDAISRLSNMLRHILYDNQQHYVTLKSELEFIDSYIALMKIRLADNVEVTQQTNISEDAEIVIAPLIFISLIENAFKHGTSATDKSFIHISISADTNKIVCEIENSNFPKTKEDRSGHGVGLEQVKRRLDLSYAGKYEWAKGVSTDGKTYKSRIILYDTQLRNYR